MGYLERRSPKFNQPDSFVSKARSVAVFLVPYTPSPESVDHRPRPGFARVARYAWGQDYHRVIKRRLQEFIELLELSREVSSEIEYRAFTDSAPIFERTLAEASKLGFIGKNTLLITPRTGSYNFIATVIWNVDVQGELAPDIKLSNCSDCINCISNCPTGAIISPGVLDSRRCISYLTIERKTAFNSAELGLLGDWAFGCDVCQQVCPYNNRGNTTEVWSEFTPNEGCGPWIDLLEAFEIGSKEEFVRRYRGTPLMRAGRECLLRNCVAVAVNTDFSDAVPSLHRLATQDESPYVRFHSKLALNLFNH